MILAAPPVRPTSSIGCPIRRVAPFGEGIGVLIESFV